MIFQVDKIKVVRTRQVDVANYVDKVFVALQAGIVEYCFTRIPSVRANDESGCEDYSTTMTKTAAVTNELQWGIQLLAVKKKRWRVWHQRKKNPITNWELHIESTMTNASLKKITQRWRFWNEWCGDGEDCDKGRRDIDESDSKSDGSEKLGACFNWRKGVRSAVEFPVSPQ